MTGRGGRAGAISFSCLMLLGCAGMLQRLGPTGELERTLASAGLAFAPMDVPAAGLMSATDAVAEATQQITPHNADRLPPASPPILGLLACPQSVTCPPMSGTSGGRRIPAWVVDFPGERLLLIDARSGKVLFVAEP
jgi:hypothetical protein